MSFLSQNASKMNYPHFCMWSIFELGYRRLRLSYRQTLAFGDAQRPSAGALGSRILISRIDFGKSHVEVENHTKMLFFGAFCSILRPFELSCALIPPETIFSAYGPHHCIDGLILHPASRGFVIYCFLTDVQSAKSIPRLFLKSSGNPLRNGLELANQAKMQ